LLGAKTQDVQLKATFSWWQESVLIPGVALGCATLLDAPPGVFLLVRTQGKHPLNPPLSLRRRKVVRKR